MSAASNYLENALANHVFGGTALTQPTQWHVAIFQADPGEDGTGSPELGARQANTAWTISTDTASNDDVLTFDQAPAGGWAVTHVAIFDASTGGNCLITDALPSTVNLNENDRLSFAASALTVRVA